MGCDSGTLHLRADDPAFQFTHPVWGATEVLLIVWIVLLSFNSRTPCGVRQVVSETLGEPMMFQFTHPVWGATLYG